MPIMLRPAIFVATLCALSITWSSLRAETPNTQLSLNDLKKSGLERSRFHSRNRTDSQPSTSVWSADEREPDLIGFEDKIQQILTQNCIDCHGPDVSEGNLRIDTLDPDLLIGADSDWWQEVFSVITKGEMPPPDEGELEEDERLQLVTWLSGELHKASRIKRQSGGKGTMRRLTRYEYNHALQDLLGLPWNFAKDLPPEAQSTEGFENNSDLLKMSVSQFEMYHRIARAALKRAIVLGEKPTTLHWGISMAEAANREWQKQDKQIQTLERKLEGKPDELARELKDLREQWGKTGGAAFYKQMSTGRIAEAEWRYHRAQYAFSPNHDPIPRPDGTDCVAILPSDRGSKLIVELGNQLPDEGILRVSVSVSRVDGESENVPSLQLMFGWQASNEGRALIRVSEEDRPVTALPGHPQVITWDVPLGEIYPRNSVRKTSSMGKTPSPSEYIRLVNSSATPSELQIDFVHVAAPVHDQWPPESHQQIFGSDGDRMHEDERVREILSTFMYRAWRRPIHDEEIESKLQLFTSIRPRCQSFEEATVEVLATVLSSPQFLYIANETRPIAVEEKSELRKLTPHSLASRLAFFLWCSVPDEKLLEAANSGQLSERHVLAEQVERMLADDRSKRFSKHFVDQWLGMELLEFQDFRRHERSFDPLLKEAMLQEPVAMFDEVLQRDASVLDFIHCDYAVINERLAGHYAIPGVFGNQFRRVQIPSNARRGGLLTQAGLLAMNSDYPDSHPLKRAVWLLESILADPPPPPPPAIPEIDLADPEIAKMTLKERIEDHRDHAACMSCHIKIDPWGIAFENYDALGRWRDKIGGKPVDASSELFNRETLNGIDGLKRFLLENRQDQFVRAMVSKLAIFALGRNLGLADRAEIDGITAHVRNNGDGLRTAVQVIVESNLFQAQ